MTEATVPATKSGFITEQDIQMPQAPGHALTPNPAEAQDVQASDEEQAQYDDLFHRVMAFVYDDRSVEGSPAPQDAVLESLNSQGAEMDRSIGTTAGNIMKQFHNAAKRQGVEYSGDVLREVGSSLVVELITLSKAAGILRGDGFDSGDDDEMTEQEADLHLKATIRATQVFGQYLDSSGQITPDKRASAKEDLMAQIAREESAGELDSVELDSDQEQMMMSLGGAANG